MSLEEVQQISESFLEGRKDLRGKNIAKEWKLILTQQELEAGTVKVAEKINRDFEGQEIVLVCVLKGCVYFFVDLTRRLKIPFSIYFLEASSYHDEQTQAEKVEILSILNPSKFKNRKVIVVDELFDNGTTINAVRDKIATELTLAPTDIYTCSLLRKDKITNERPLDIVGFETLPDIWLVGFGLDDAQEKRAWPHLYACPKIAGIPLTEADKVFEETDEGRTVYQQVRSRLLQEL
eukprot:TRINITY_DN16380_c0_g1_i1.p1 TRINITY_DN16380_c0_g1~~TRINITY_DN16380_c0_g1_i1.p1  ORF type:complete len:271 (+),score=126.25 TRINITY_DN16380_c0_g1_i1:108-815(+)